MRRPSTPFRHPPPPPELHWLWQRGAVSITPSSCVAIWKRRRDQRRAAASAH